MNVPKKYTFRFPKLCPFVSHMNYINVLLHGSSIMSDKKLSNTSIYMYQNTHSINCIPPFHSVPLFRKCCTLLAQPISPEIMDGFWCSRCLNNRIDLPNMIGSFASGATSSLIAENGTKSLSQLFEELRYKIWNLS